MKHWPSYTKPNEKAYTRKHVAMLETTLGYCNQFRLAIQAGGSIGYWPARMAEVFERVITFEPEHEMFECLVKNLAKFKNVEVHKEALGGENRKVDLQLSGFGSHFIIEGEVIDMIRLDNLNLVGVDLIQLDIEGFEFEALEGAQEIVDRCRPIIQVEILKTETAFALNEFFGRHRYKQVHQFARDYVFAPK